MRAKYFLKGMGIGVTVTALLFTIAFALNPPTLSDEEVIARAKVLGMVESDEMEEEQEAMSAEETQDESEASDEEAMKALRKLMDEQEAADADNAEDDTPAYKSTDTVSDSGEDSETPGSTVAFTVNSGEDSSTVAARLHRAGIITNPVEFDTYLSTNGYDTRIHPGSYNIPTGASYEAIANAIAY